MNGHREPDRDSLWRLSIFFLVDPWEIMEASARDFLRALADPQRFEAVEQRITDGATADQLDRTPVEDVGVELTMEEQMARAIAERPPGIADRAGTSAQRSQSIEKGRSRRATPSERTV